MINVFTFIFCLKKELLMTFSLPSNNWANILFFFPEYFCSFEQTMKDSLFPLWLFDFTGCLSQVVDVRQVWKPSLLPGGWMWFLKPSRSRTLDGQTCTASCRGVCFSPGFVKNPAVLTWERGIYWSPQRFSLLIHGTYPEYNSHFQFAVRTKRSEKRKGRREEYHL